MDQLHRFSPPLAGGAASLAFLWQPTQETDAMAEELKQALLRTTLELESTRAAAQSELRKMESQALHLTSLLEAATRERDEARHALLLLLVQHAEPPPEPKPNPAPNSVQTLTLDAGSNAAASEDADEGGMGASPALAEVEAAATRRGLPEKGRLVEAVMGAGPLLQTLLLAGPLPQWRHPPPDLRGSEIPPVAMALGPNPKMEKDGDGSPSPTSLWNSSPSSSSLESDNNKFQNVPMMSSGYVA